MVITKNKIKAPTVFVDYMMATIQNEQESPKRFLDVLRNYINRPFDDRKTVFLKMDTSQSEALQKLWEEQVELLRNLEKELGLKFPLEASTLEENLTTLGNTLFELVYPLINQLGTKLKEDSLSLSEQQEAEDILLNMAKAYAFHLLTDVTPKSRLNDHQYVNVLQEFHRLLRRSIFTDNVYGHFVQDIGEKIESQLNAYTLTIYKQIVGPVAERIFLNSFLKNIDNIHILDLYAIENVALPLIDNKEISNVISNAIEKIRTDRWIQFIDSHSSYKSAKTIFDIIEKKDPNKKLIDIKKHGLNCLVEIASQLPFENVEEKRVFIKNIIDAAKTIHYQKQVKKLLLSNLEKHPDKDILAILNLSSKNRFCLYPFSQFKKKDTLEDVEEKHKQPRSTELKGNDQSDETPPILSPSRTEFLFANNNNGEGEKDLKNEKDNGKKKTPRVHSKPSKQTATTKLFATEKTTSSTEKKSNNKPGSTIKPNKKD